MKKLSTFGNVITVKNGSEGSPGAMIYPLGEWSVSTKYIGTALAKPYVLYKNERYILNVNGELLGGLTPADDVVQNKGNWLRMTSYKAIYTDIIMANFGNIGEAIFNGEWEFSQSGIDAAGNPTSEYKNFNPNQITGGKFTPYTLYNHKTGYVHFAAGLVVIKDGNATFGGELNGVSGTFNTLSAKSNEGSEIILSTNPLSLRILNKKGAEVLSLHDYFVNNTQIVGQLRVNFSDETGKLYKQATIDPLSIFIKDLLNNDAIELSPFALVLQDGGTGREFSIRKNYSTKKFNISNTAWSSYNEVGKGDVYLDGNTLKVKQ